MHKQGLELRVGLGMGGHTGDTDSDRSGCTGDSARPATLQEA